MPPERGDGGYQRVSQRVQVIGIAFEDVEWKRDIDGKPSYVQSEFQLVLVINVSVEVSRFGARYSFRRRLVR
jgi:hypothetical protein